MPLPSTRALFRATPLILAMALGAAHAAPQSELLELAKKEQQPYLDTLRDLVHIESGSKDVAGVKKIAEYIAGKLRAQGGKVGKPQIHRQHPSRPSGATRLWFPG